MKVQMFQASETSLYDQGESGLIGPDKIKIY